MPLARLSKPDQVMTIGAPDRAPASAASPDGDTTRDFTVSVSRASSSATSSPFQR